MEEMKICAFGTVRVYCKNNGTFISVPQGSPLIEIYDLAGAPLRYPPMSARVNQRVEGLDYRCWNPKDIEFVDYTHPAGYRTYIRSLCYILTKAVHDLYPEVAINLEHAISKGYYCTFEDGRQLSQADVGRIRRRMEETVGADIPFRLQHVRTSDAIRLFRKCGMNDKALLIETVGMAYTSYYEMDGYINYFYGCLLPSSGHIHLFDLIPYEGGMLLRAPRQDDPTRLPAMFLQKKMFRAYKEYLVFQRTLNVMYAGDLNRAVENGAAREIVMVSEAMQEKQIAHIAEEIARRYSDGVRVILIAGPSSSGKTTFCRRLEVQLITNLLHPVGISLDDYYLNREDTPRDANGAYDFESLYAIDLPYFDSDLQKLIDGGEVDLPSFDFETGKRVYRGEKLRMKANSVLLLEGIHGLNPELTAKIPPQNIFRIYVSALTTISLDGHNWIPTSDNRLLRRIVRDYRSRGYSAKETIAMWPRIREGEEKWIFPYQENADATFNSAMIYELAVLRKFAEPMLSEIREMDGESAEAYRLLRFLRYFRYIPVEELPATSLLREFLGGGHFLE
ncbi:MAG: nucleoside kinase [Tannerella sp.]|jgi:uridine kinase|nr:nucleoside kinase [Tannerella sp.]